MSLPENILGYIFFGSKCDFEKYLKEKVVGDDYKVYFDDQKTFLFDFNIEKKYKLFTPFFKYQIENNIVTYYKNSVLFSFQKVVFQKNNACYLVQDVIKDENFLFSPGEKEAQKSWKFFKKNFLSNYESKRDFLDKKTTSNLSQYINAGSISVRQLWCQAIEECGFEKSKKFL